MHISKTKRFRAKEESVWSRLADAEKRRASGHVSQTQKNDGRLFYWVYFWSGRSKPHNRFYSRLKTLYGRLTIIFLEFTQWRIVVFMSMISALMEPCDLRLVA